MANNELITGIYRVFDEDTGETFLGFSQNVVGTLKRLRFELMLNACPNKQLQKFYTSAKSPKMELIEDVHILPEMNEYEIDALLRARLYYNRELQGENTKLIQTEI
ncbi:MAG: hypothetical protein RRY79_01810 [Clostridia bacterium]